MEVYMSGAKRCPAYWIIIIFLVLSLILLVAGQTMAIINYDFAVKLGLQENVSEVGAFGVQMNRAFGAGDTVIYLPLILVSLAGLFLRKQWSLITTAATAGISAYWAAVLAIATIFFKGVPGFNLEAGPGYWIVFSAYIAFGFWTILYLIFRGDKLTKY
jgi:hypothetical protein